MTEDFTTRLGAQLREAAERDARRRPLERAVRPLVRPVAIGLACLAALAVAVAGVGRIDLGSAPPADRGGLRVVVRAAPVSQGADLVAGDGALWAADGAGAVVRIDPGTGKALARLPVAGTPASVWPAFGSLWVFDADAGRLLRLDPRTGAVQATIGLGLGARVTGWLYSGHTRVWFVSAASELLAIDPERNAVARRISLERGGLAARGGVADDRAFYDLAGDGALLSFDRQTGARGAVTRARVDGTLIGAAGGIVYATRGERLVALDARTGRARWTQSLGARVLDAITVAGGSLYVHGSPASGGPDTLWRVDPASGQLLDSLALPEFGVRGLTAAAGRVWALTPGGTLLGIAR